MLLKDIFLKPIDRDIKGVIKVGQIDDANIKQELEEYVVTRELQKHFADFFTSYKRGIQGETDKIGVWISGFFGSGKSHFLKILSYLLENKEVSGKMALDYFIDDNKIEDQIILADMKFVANHADKTDVILFNIDSKSESGGGSDRDTIVQVFLKVFNEMQGYYGPIPMLAELERHLDENDRYQEFKDLFKKKTGNDWVEVRNEFHFIQNSITEVLAEMNYMSADETNNWYERTKEQHSISIESFAKLVRKYLDSKGKDHRIVFLVDEVGQYIGDDSKLMLNLQTITEDLGVQCGGRAWIIVTSQEDIDSIAKKMSQHSNDFSKIIARFDTKLSLSSAHVDEVIKMRILEKNTFADKALIALYDKHSAALKNRLIFTESAEQKTYEDARDFSANYPFVPYQFNLLSAVLTSIRTHGASGKHLSGGERSMLALFKESAMRLMNEEIGVLIPFNLFYDALHKFLDHSHSGVIIRALNNGVINPSGDEDCFAVNVLKALFMVKYVKEITANVENITSLMLSSLDQDRLVLKQNVEEALEVLIQETLIQRNGQVYVFLTNEEQEVNKEIDRQGVSTTDLIAKVGETIYAGIYRNTKYQDSRFGGRYSFNLNQIIDDHNYKLSGENKIGIRILSPYAEMAKDDTSLKMRSSSADEVFVVLPDDRSFLDEFLVSLKIEKYLRQGIESSLVNYDSIKSAKSTEMIRRRDEAMILLNDALSNVKIFVNGDLVQKNTSNIVEKINDALEKLVAKVYNKLDYIDTQVSLQDIKSLLNSSDQQTISLEDVTEANSNALNDILGYIAMYSDRHTPTSMKNLLNNFMGAPYGFVEEDVEWAVAKLFKKGEIALSLSGAGITIINKTGDEIFNYITKKDYVDKLQIERREKVSEQQKKSAREVMTDLFGSDGVYTGEDSMMDFFFERSKNMLYELENYKNMQGYAPYPGTKVVVTGEKLLHSMMQTQSPSKFFEKLHNQKDEFLDFAEDLEPLKAFFGGEQKAIYKKALEYQQIYNNSKTFIMDKEITSTIAKIDLILEDENPYGKIKDLQELNNEFMASYQALLGEKSMPVKEDIDRAEKVVFTELEKKPYKGDYHKSFSRQFKELHEKLEKCNDIAILTSISAEANILKQRLLDEIVKRDEEIGLKTPVVSEETISIDSLNISRSWEVSSADDVERYVKELSKRIIEQIKEGITLHVKF